MRSSYSRGRGGGGYRGGRGGGRGRGRGRGAYYKAKYGGRGGGSRSQHKHHDSGPVNRVGSQNDLEKELRRIDGKSYNAYKDIRGLWSFDNCNTKYVLGVNHVQGDSYAPPSRCHVLIEHSQANVPSELVSSRTRRVALADYFTRCFWKAAHAKGTDKSSSGKGWSGPKGGNMSIDKPGQHVLERTSVIVTETSVEARFTVALPARGRSIMGRRAIEIFVRDIPLLVDAALNWNGSGVDQNAGKKHVLCVEDQESLRGQLRDAGLTAFIVNGSILPRDSGASDLPMDLSTAVAFSSPTSLEHKFTVPNSGLLVGCGIPQGVTLIVGGGFHGKSTLLKALEVGCYNHIPGDGREFVVTDADALKIRAEDGRAIHSLDISAFINNLPMGKGTTEFSTSDASGSTSQAANIVEALQAGSKTLLMDEDSCATNFMIRDEQMAHLLPSHKEPITPFLSRARQLWQNLKVSTVLVVGGAGCFFSVADTVILMDCYKATDVTAKAKAIAHAFAQNESKIPQIFLTSKEDGDAPMLKRARKNTEGVISDDDVIRSLTCSNQCSSSRRSPLPHSLAVRGDRGKVMCRDKKIIEYGATKIDLCAIEQLVETSQTRATAYAVQWLGKQKKYDSMADMKVAIDGAMDSEEGMDHFGTFTKLGNMARPRALEVIAAVNRLRHASFQRGC